MRLIIVKIEAAWVSRETESVAVVPDAASARERHRPLLLPWATAIVGGLSPPIDTLALRNQAA